MKMQKLSLWIRVPLTLRALGVILWWESRRPLRRAVESKPRRISRNVAIAAVSAAAMQVAGRPVVGPLTALVERRQWGLLKWVSLPRWVEVPLALVLLDYTLDIWHVLMHRVSWLWRFHVVHHIDLDLDTSTALRFHFGELTVSVAWQVGQVVLLGVSPSPCPLPLGAPGRSARGRGMLALNSIRVQRYRARLYKGLGREPDERVVLLIP